MPSVAITGIREVFACKPYLTAFIILSLGLVALYFILTNVYVLSLGTFLESLQPANALLIAAVAILTSLLLVMSVYQARAVASVSVKTKAGFLGGIVGIFASACPVCYPIWLAWIGFGGSIAAIADYSLPILGASILLLAFGIYSSGKAIATKTCPPTKSTVVARS